MTVSGPLGFSIYFSHHIDLGALQGTIPRQNVHSLNQNGICKNKSTYKNITMLAAFVKYKISFMSQMKLDTDRPTSDRRTHSRVPG